MMFATISQFDWSTNIILINFSNVDSESFSDS